MYSLTQTPATLSGCQARIAVPARAGVVAIVAVGSDYESNQRVLEVAARYAGFVYPALGLHPGRLDVAMPVLERHLQSIEDNIKHAVAVGEVGLDYHKRVMAHSSKDQQKDVLATVLNIARRHGKPAILHSRYAWRDCFEVTRTAGVETAVFHWYTGPTNVLQDILSQGYYVSATPAAEYHAEHRRAIREAPLERLLLETDSPVTYREHRSEPADVIRSLEAAAAAKGLSPDEVAASTTENAVRLFRLIF
ncbi:MAG: TatD family hydrolase [Chloroflexi bacterium]|nr:TatD family hydrolase [Chloroflexota bacterium]